jgi:hypothetical protein
MNRGDPPFKISVSTLFKFVKIRAPRFAIAKQQYSGIYLVAGLGSQFA